MPVSEPRVAVIDLITPPSVNKIRKLNKKALRDYEAWRVKCDRLVTKQWAEAKLLHGTSRPAFGNTPVVVTIEVSEKVRHDLDNVLKAVIDYCVRVELIGNDSKRFVRRIIVDRVAPGLAPEGVRITIARDERFRLKY